jgi:hypothetical protein
MNKHMRVRRTSRELCHYAPRTLIVGAALVGIVVCVGLWTWDMLDGLPSVALPEEGPIEPTSYMLQYASRSGNHQPNVRWTSLALIEQRG